MTRIFSRQRGSALIALLSSAIAPLALGQSVTWTGGGTNANWDNVHIAGLNVFYVNWGNVNFDPGGNSDVFFGAAFGSGNPDLNGGRAVKSVTITTASSIAFVGNAGDVFAFPALTRTAAASGTQTFSTIVDLSGAATTWNVDGAGGITFANTVGEAVAGSALTKNGAAQVNLGSGNSDIHPNTWTGATTISAGTLELNKAGGTTALPSTSVVVNGGTLLLNNTEQINSAAVVTINSGTFDLNGFTETIGGLSGGGTIATGASTGALYVNQSTTTLDKSAFTGSGTIAKQGGGTLTLNPTGSLGAFECDAGTFNVSAASVTLNGGTVLAVNGGTFNLQDFSTVSLTDTASTAYADSGGTMNVSGSHTTLNLPFQSFAGINGVGTITIDAATVNVETFLGAGFASGSTGTMTIRNGAQVNVPSLFASAKRGSTGSITITGAGTLLNSTRYIGLGGSDSSAADIGGTGTLTVANSASVITPFLNFYSTAGSLVIDHGMLSAGQIQEFASGRISISDGTASALTLGTNNNTSTYAGSISDYTSGPGSLTKVGAGTLMLTNAANSFTGPLNINGGVVVAPSVAASGTPSIIGAGSSINFNGGTLEVTGPSISASDRTVSLSGSGGTIQVDESALLVGAVSGAAPFTKTGFGSLTTIGLSASSVSILSGSFAIAGLLTASSMTISFGATVTLGATSTVSGPVSDSGLLTLDSLLSVGSLGNTGQIQIDNPFGALTFGIDGSTYTFAGQIRSSAGGTGAVTKSGAGTVTLTGLNTYTGPTTVAAGTLVLNNSLSSTGAPMTILSGATLSASGFLPRQILGTGTLSAGGDLFVGDNSNSGYSFGGSLVVGSHAVQLLALQQATLGTSTTLVSGKIIATGTGGLVIPAGATLTSTGSSEINAVVTNNGSISAPLPNGSLTFDGDVTGAGTYSGSLTFSKNFTLNSATARLSADSVTLGSNAIFQQTTSTATSALIQNQGQLRQSGGSSSYFQISGAGSIVLSGGSLSTTNLKQGSLTITAGTASIVSSLAPGPNTLNELTMQSPGKLDLFDNDLIISYTGHSPQGAIAAYLATGFNQGSWDGAGIASTTARNDAAFTTALGYADNSALHLTQFDNQPVGANSVFIKYTYYGDANLDGKVDAADFQMLLDGLVATNASSWTQGDFTYDGRVDLGNDFDLFLVGYLKQGNALGDLAPIILDESDLSVAQRATLLALVPEPSAVSLLSIAACLLGRRRHRRRRRGGPVVPKTPANLTLTGPISDG